MFSFFKSEEKLVAYFDVIDFFGKYKKLKGFYSLGLNVWVISMDFSKYITNEDGTFVKSYGLPPTKWTYHTPAETKKALQEYILKHSEIGKVEVEKTTSSFSFTEEVFPDIPRLGSKG